MGELESRFQKIRQSVPAHVTLIAVSKTQPVEVVEALYRLGHRDFGENYVQELVEKARLMKDRGCSGIRWHFIGRLQTNKVKTVLPIVDSIHSVDSVKLAEEISKRIQSSGRRVVPCFLSVNIDREESKSGFFPEDAPAAAEKISALPGIELRGLMCIPAPRPSAAEIKPAFTALRKLEESCRPFTQGGLSMGMSEDFEMAIAEGSSAVRIGSRIFGPRKNQ